MGADQSSLWNEAKDKLQHSGYGLSCGHQQRLCHLHAALHPGLKFCARRTCSRRRNPISNRPQLKS